MFSWTKFLRFAILARTPVPTGHLWRRGRLNPPREKLLAMRQPTIRRNLSRTILSRAGLALMAVMFAAALIPSVASAKTVVVKMTDKPPRFVPENVTIKVGDTVQWINNAKSLHSATFNPAHAQNPADVSLPKGAKPFDSGFMAPGAKYSHKFTVPGTYKYVCIPHEKDGMKGEVIVKK